MNQLQAILTETTNNPSLAISLISVLGIAIALVNCFFGYRLLKVWVTVVGALCGGLIAWVLCGELAGTRIPINTLTQVLISVAAAFLMGFLAMKIYRFGIFLLISAVSFSFLYSLMLDFLGSAANNGVYLLVSLLLGVVLGILAVFLLKPFLIVCTGITGAYTAVTTTLSLANLNDQTILFCSFLLLAILGTLFQFFHCRRYA